MLKNILYAFSLVVLTFSCKTTKNKIHIDKSTVKTVDGSIFEALPDGVGQFSLNFPESGGTSYKVYAQPFDDFVDFISTFETLLTNTTRDRKEWGAWIIEAPKNSGYSHQIQIFSGIEGLISTDILTENLSKLDFSKQRFGRLLLVHTHPELVGEFAEYDITPSYPDIDIANQVSKNGAVPFVAIVLPQCPECTAKLFSYYPGSEANILVK